MSADRFWRAVGGRKNFNAYLAYLTLTVMAFPLGATFTQYAGAILLALGITSGLVAFEDRKPRRPAGSRRATDPPPPEEIMP